MGGRGDFALCPGSHTKAYERRQAGLGERKMGAPASLDTCENLIEMLLRRRQLSLTDRARNYRKYLLELGHPATLPAAKAYPQVISGLMWEACWRGMSTALQVASPPLHAQTLTVKWWMSTPASLRFGPSEYLLRSLSASLQRIDLEHANAKRRWEQMGKPEYLSTSMVTELDAASALRSEVQPMAYEGGQYQLEVALPPQSVAAIRFAG